MKNKAFTMLELIIGMAVVAVLATLGIAGITILQRSTRDSERRSIVNTINLQMEELRGSIGRYPEVVGRVNSSTTNQLRICPTSACNSNVRTVNLTGSSVIFLTNPTDGQSTTDGTVYCFSRASNGSSFSIGVSLEGGGSFHLGNGAPCSFTTNAI